MRIARESIICNNLGDCPKMMILHVIHMQITFVSITCKISTILVRNVRVRNMMVLHVISLRVTCEPFTCKYLGSYPKYFRLHARLFLFTCENKPFTCDVAHKPI